MSNKSFHLRWNNHLQNLQSLFENLYIEQILVDVTIACSDGLLHGHKLVLSACSPYFEQILKENPCKHPVIILKGIRAREMQVLLQYMYMGSVDVGEDELELLLDVATELQVKGLVQKHDKPQQSSQLPNISQTRNETNSSPNSPPCRNSDDLSWQAELVAKPPVNKSKEVDNSESRINTSDETVGLEMKVEAVDEEDDQEPIEENIKDYNIESESLKEPANHSTFSTTENEETVYFCHICNRGFQSKGSYHRHMLTHAGVKPHSCNFCEQSFLRLSHLQRHIRVHTGERPYQCSRCPKQFARSDKLRQHYILQHSDGSISKISKPRGRPRKHPNSYGPPLSTPGLSPVFQPMSAVRSTISISPVTVSNSV